MTASRLTTVDIRACKGVRPVVVLTAYDVLMAQLVDTAADMILVGDSLGMVRFGLPDTLGVSIEMMEHAAAAVYRGASRSLVLIDLPFGSYEASPQQAFTSAARLMRAGAGAIKLEGGAPMIDTVRFLTQRGIPVCGHLGLTPQAVHVLGGYKVQGRDTAGADHLRRDALALAEAGAFALVLEAVPAALGNAIAASLSIPVIGIGAGACDGQVLVSEDLLGLTTGKPPKFVKRYADIAATIKNAVAQFADDVRQGRFPDSAHSYNL